MLHYFLVNCYYNCFYLSHLTIINPNITVNLTVVIIHYFFQDS